MNRTITTRRIYNLGQYQSLEVIDSIAEIPEGVVFDEEHIRRIRQIELLSVESQNTEYLTLANKLAQLSLEERAEVVTETLNKISEILKDI